MASELTSWWIHEFLQFWDRSMAQKSEYREYTFDFTLQWHNEEKKIEHVPTKVLSLDGKNNESKISIDTFASYCSNSNMSIDENTSPTYIEFAQRKKRAAGHKCWLVKARNQFFFSRSTYHMYMYIYVPTNVVPYICPYNTTIIYFWQEKRYNLIGDIRGQSEKIHTGICYFF